MRVDKIHLKDRNERASRITNHSYSWFIIIFIIIIIIIVVIIVNIGLSPFFFAYTS